MGQHQRLFVYLCPWIYFQTPCLQLARLQEEAQEYGQRQEAAKAVLNAAKTAQRQGSSLSETEISSIEDPILSRPTKEPPQQKACLLYKPLRMSVLCGDNIKFAGRVFQKPLIGGAFACWLA